MSNIEIPRAAPPAMPSTIYVVTSTTGEYSDRAVVYLCWYATAEEAEARVAKEAAAWSTCRYGAPEFGWLSIDKGPGATDEARCGCGATATLNGRCMACASREAE